MLDYIQGNHATNQNRTVYLDTSNSSKNLFNYRGTNLKLGFACNTPEYNNTPGGCTITVRQGAVDIIEIDVSSPSYNERVLIDLPDTDVEYTVNASINTDPGDDTPGATYIPDRELVFIEILTERNTNFSTNTKYSGDDPSASFVFSETEKILFEDVKSNGYTTNSYLEGDLISNDLSLNYADIKKSSTCKALYCFYKYPNINPSYLKEMSIIINTNSNRELDASNYSTMSSSYQQKELTVCKPYYGVSSDHLGFMENMWRHGNSNGPKLSSFENNNQVEVNDGLQVINLGLTNPSNSEQNDWFCIMFLYSVDEPNGFRLSTDTDTKPVVRWKYEL